MKTTHFLTVLWFGLVGFNLAAATNVQYRTLTQEVEEYLGGNWVMHAPPSEAYAVTPEEVNAGGTWSQPLEGFSLSLRFRTNSFLAGKPVLAYLYLRNITTNASLSYSLQINQGNHWSLGGIEIMDASNNQLTPRPLVMIMGKTLGRQLEPLAQQRFLVRLDRTFELKSGQYRIRARAKLPKMEQDGTVELTTDWVTIKVIAE